MIMLKTQKEKTQAKKLAKEMTAALKTVISRSEALRELYMKAGDWGTCNSFAHYTNEFEEILECDNGEAGLLPFVRKCLEDIDNS